MDRSQIRKNMFFRQMEDAEVSECLAALEGREKEYRKGDLILRAGDTTENMGIVLSGSVTVERIDPWGNRTILSQVGEGGFFAETYALMKGTVLLVDVEANADCRVLFLDLQRLQGQKLLRASWYPKLLSALLAVSIQKNLMLSERSFHTAPKSIREKLLSYLNTVSLKKHSQEFDIPFDRQQLSDYLNVDRTALSKELGKMRSEGIIECRRNHFVLLDQ